ncbi:hypothetical protein VaNZ11_006911 [Volvox africanus]|uniref:Uncharacterized protein n=1 Tax=Volvox africanus TaxID=51714 RepID=A0ABQ5S1S0_9CHLO|nr:hypothetical protein VaNZ11_006911 [Volvox africanus]
MTSILHMLRCGRERRSAKERRWGQLLRPGRLILIALITADIAAHVCIRAGGVYIRASGVCRIAGRQRGHLKAAMEAADLRCRGSSCGLLLQLGVDDLGAACWES